MTNTNSAHFARGDYVDYGVRGDLNGATRMTCALLLRADTSWTPTRYLVWMNSNAGDSGPFGLFTSVQGGRLHFTAWINGGLNIYDADVAVPSTSTWVFLVFTYDNGAGTFYYQGAPLATFNDVIAPGPLDNAANALRVGDSLFGQAVSLDVVALWAGYTASAATVASWWNGAAVVHPYESVGAPAPTRELAFDGSFASTPAGWAGTAHNDTLPPPSITFGSPGPTTDAGAPTLAITPNALPNGTVGALYNQALAANDVGSGPYAWSLASGALPPGLALNAATGAITGTPTTAGAYAFTVQVDRTSAATGSQAFNVTIAASGLVVSPTVLAAGRVGSLLSVTFAAAGGGAGATSWRIAGGVLPAGLTLDASSGVLSGTPLVSGPYNFTVEASREGGNYLGSAALALQIGQILTITPPTLPDGREGDLYEVTLTAVGGSGEWPYAWSLVGGALPPGLALGSSPTNMVGLTGTPTLPGSYTFTIAASIPHDNDYGERTYTVTIAGLEPEPVVEDMPAPGVRHRHRSGASLYVTASGAISRSNDLGRPTITHPSAGVYVITPSETSRRSLLDYHASVHVVANLPRTARLRRLGEVLEIRTAAPGDVPADSNFSVYFERR